MKPKAQNLIERHVVDHLNHDDLVGPGGGGGGLPEAPISGQTYGRGGGAWWPVLSLDSTQINDVRGPLLIPYGTQGVPSLMIGSNDTGFYRQGAITYLRTSGAFSMAWHPNGVQAWVPLNMGAQKVVSLADPEDPQDAVNLRTLAGQWTNFVPDPGWEANTIRTRLLDGGKSLQMAGDIQAPLPVNARARVGILPEGSRPSRAYRTPGVSALGVSFGWAMWEISPNGEVWTQWSVGAPPTLGVGSVNAVVPLD